MNKPNLLLAYLAAAGLILGGCGKKSDAERAGDKVEGAVEDVEDGITNDGPKENAEEAGDKVEDEIEDRTD